MIVISFDIGIKNMGYCIFKLSDQTDEHKDPCCPPFEILDWAILNLTQPTNSIVYFCNSMNKPKSKKGEYIECKKIAKYTKIEDCGCENSIVHYYCKKHALESGNSIVSNMKRMLSTYKKSTKESVIEKCKELKIEINEKDSKPNILSALEKHIKQHSIQPIESVKQNSANDVDLISVGKQMKIMLDANPYIDQITHVIIENQISPIANRMKTIQGMLSQYFIMKNDNIHIEFISSSNKLKQFSKIETDSMNVDVVVAAGDGISNSKTKYKEHKKDGIFYCDEILSKNAWLNMWISKINIKKKDDLADCFLQGLWYLKKAGHIQYINNLLITCG
jgi:hypothetical protein